MSATKQHLGEAIEFARQYKENAQVLKILEQCYVEPSYTNRQKAVHIWAAASALQNAATAALNHCDDVPDVPDDDVKPEQAQAFTSKCNVCVDKKLSNGVDCPNCCASDIKPVSQTQDPIIYLAALGGPKVTNVKSLSDLHDATTKILDSMGKTPRFITLDTASFMCVVDKLTPPMMLEPSDKDVTEFTFRGVRIPTEFMFRGVRIRVQP